MSKVESNGVKNVVSHKINHDSLWVKVVLKRGTVVLGEAKVTATRKGTKAQWKVVDPAFRAEIEKIARNMFKMVNEGETLGQGIEEARATYAA